MHTLYLVSTPIGNRADISIRALETLWNVDVILCEDTRTTQELLNTYKSRFDRPYPKLLSYNDHNRDRRIPAVLDLLIKGQDVALVSDQGTPILSDPGYGLTKEIYKLNDPKIVVEVIPGANALLPALQLSGFPPDRFFFAGFLPKSDKRRREMIANFPSTTVIIYESPRRIRELLEQTCDVLGPEKKVAICRELTKKHQEALRGSVDDLLGIDLKERVKGEVVVVIDNNPQKG
ncbi:16S rRNA (cytidine(1402)-2'-O)-methyltransferase [candidate division WWE3 bacterium]|uniref:Ribosomal RNA small subunit methyltransferase I n=1 Tax=candidate division WWE3 bacterium TaxID=2053526 RepID=A0A955LLD6_UNCKA|nr:16S rRNA (cytidine(1402)-2'-O)-methyltransferase [candidate division WWE3 bacterium]